MPALSSRLKRAQPAATVQMSILARELQARGHHVISLTIGEPDFATPRHAIDAAYGAALAGDTKYPPIDGEPALKAAVQRKFKEENRLDFALDEIAVSNGGKQSIFNAMIVTMEPGDEVVIPSPYWVAYPLLTCLLGGEPVFVSCAQNNGFKLRPEDLDAAITPRTKWLILNFPNNPTGAACTRPELRAIADVMDRYPHVWIMDDAIYEHLRYDRVEHVTIAEVAPELRDRIVTISGVSKTYAMTGWRVGFCGGPKTLIKAMVTMQGHATAGVSTVGQAAALAALVGPQDGVEARAEAYRRRRDLVVAGLNACAGINCHRPEGAFYVFPNIAGCLGRTSAGGRRIETDEDFCLALLAEQHVAVVHGGAFGISPYVRLSYASDDAVLEEACRRIKVFCNELH
ncbi:MAG: pyridoxal phosphate-dependent aminotransferase [Acetobacteraceae bacterium]|nr:pyridoxal phosphate-dependent aminotransferase [Acetobacteraceae bacterium]